MGDIKLVDIAKAMGISTVTVSNALSGKKGVSDELREEIQEKARELGYSLDRYQRQAPFRIGVLISWKYVEIGASFYWEMYQHVAYTASKRQGTTMVEIPPMEDERDLRLPKLVRESTVDGLVVIGWMERDYIRNLTERAGIPVVLLDFKYRDLPCDAVMSGNYFGSYKVTRYLIDRGHQDIAFVGTIQANENILDRYFGYRKALEEYGYYVRREWLIEDRELVHGDMLEIVLPEKMPTAFVCNCDFTASLLYNVLREKGYRIPEDISIVGYDNYLYGHPFARELTTYSVDMRRMAETAVKRLLSKGRRDEKKNAVFCVDSQIVERSSVKSLR